MNTQRTNWNDGKSTIITSPYVVKSKALSFLLQEAIPSLRVNYQEHFKPISKFSMRNIYRVVYRGDQSEAYETLGPGMVLTSFPLGSVGLACTMLVSMSLTLGEPTLLYKDTLGQGAYSDITAEWWPQPFLSELPKRLAQHASMFHCEPLAMQEVERQAEDYLSHGDNRATPNRHERPRDVN